MCAVKVIKPIEPWEEPICMVPVGCVNCIAHGQGERIAITCAFRMAKQLNKAPK
jgi:hypothetical protein